MIPGLGFQEFLLLAVAALVIIGPKDLPLVMRRLGQFFGKAQAMAQEFRAAFDDIARQTELEEMKKEIEALRRDNALRTAADEFAEVEREINTAVMKGAPLAQNTNADSEQNPEENTDPNPEKVADDPNKVEAPSQSNAPSNTKAEEVKND